MAIVTLATFTALHATRLSNIDTTVDRLVAGYPSKSADMLRLSTYQAAIGRRADMDASLRTVDVAGLIDINAAHSALLKALFDDIGRDRDMFERYSDLRQDNPRFGSLEEVSALLELDRAQTETLLSVATVYSGRSTLSLDHAPEQLKTILVDAGISSGDALLSGAPTNAIYALYRQAPDRSPYLIGTAWYNTQQREVRILEMR